MMATAKSAKKKSAKRKTPTGKPAAGSVKQAARQNKKAPATDKKKPIKAAPKPAAKKAAKQAAPKPAPAKKKVAKKKVAKKQPTASAKAAPSAVKRRPDDDYRRILLELSDRLSGQITSLKKDSLTRSDEVNVEEDGTDAFDRQFALTLASSENDALLEIEQALLRIREGAFGMCEECGGVIEPARLDAIPFVRNCIGCQSEIEKRRPTRRPGARLT